MKTELFSVSKIFTENLFRIPDYQRGYSWTEKQLRDFWNDLNQLEPGKDHYAGVLTLEDVSKDGYTKWDDDLWIIESKKFSPYYVVDGQQRLTTTIILIQCMTERLKKSEVLNYTSRDKIREKYIFESKDKGISRSYIFGYEKDNPSYEFLKTHVFQETSDNHHAPEETIYTQNLALAKSFFSEKLKELALADLEKLYTKITQHLLFNIYSISKDIDVFVTFETMNNRGKPLSHLELLKNRLIYLSTKISTDAVERAKLRKVINESWKTAYHYLGKNKKRPLSDNFFLLIHFLLYFRNRIETANSEKKGLAVWKMQHDEQYKDMLLEGIFTSKNIYRSSDDPEAVTLKFINDYSRDIKQTVKLYFEIFNPEDSSFSDREKILLEKVRRLSQVESAMLLVALFSAGHNQKERADFIEVLERYLFVDSVSPFIRQEAAVEMDKLAVALYFRKKDIPAVTIELRALLDVAIREANFSKVMADWGQARGYYGWRGIRYFLFEYEQELLAQSKTKRVKLLWDEFAVENFEEDYRTVEHIYPQKPTDKSWTSAFDGYSTREKNQLRNSIGNLIPLSKPKNSSLSNKSFAEKCGSVENKVGYAYGCYSEIEVSKVPSWGAREIAQRGLQLLSFMETRWGIPIGDEKEKLKILSLEFVSKRHPDILKPKLRKSAAKRSL